MTPRDEVLAALVDLVPAGRGPVLVAVDGGDGAGKTCFADALGEALTGAGRTVGRGGIDDFLHPPSHRHALGRTPRTVWERSTDLDAVRRELVGPWRAREDDAVLVVDGVFVQRPELADAWDLVVWLEVADEVRVARMAVRDGSVDDVANPDQQRYLGAQRIYRETCDPVARADVVVDHSDWERPRIARARRRRPV